MSAPAQSGAPLAPLDHFAPADLDTWRRQLRAELDIDTTRDPEATIARVRDGKMAPALVLPGHIEAGAARPLRTFDLAAGNTSQRAWEVVSACDAADVDALVARIRAEHAGGAGGVWLSDAAARMLVEAELHGADGALVRGLLWFLPGGPRAPALARRLCGLGARGIVVGLDPAGQRAQLGSSIDPAGLCADSVAAARAAHELNGDGPAVVRGPVVDASVYHGAGAGPALELGALLAALVDALRRWDGAGIETQSLLRTIVVRIAVGQELVEECAKLRAARVLLHGVLASLGVADARPWIHGVAARRSHSVRDPWVNLLRSGASAVAAALGGADAVTTAAHDGVLGEPSPEALRVARNTQLVLRDEAQIGAVVDPLGGSFAVEEATQRLARAGYAVFQSIQAGGGLWAELENGAFARRVEADQRARLQRVRALDAKLTGVTVSPATFDPRERGAFETPAPAGPKERASDALAGLRDAAPFEALVRQVHREAHAPWVLLVAVGSATAHRARTEFCRALIEIAAVAVREVAASADAGAIASTVESALENGSAPLGVCLAMADADFETVGMPAVAALAERGIAVHVAGVRGELEAKFRARGAAGFVRRGDDAVQCLEGLLAGTKMEAKR